MTIQRMELEETLLPALGPNNHLLFIVSKQLLFFSMLDLLQRHIDYKTILD